MFQPWRIALIIVTLAGFGLMFYSRGLGFLLAAIGIFLLRATADKPPDNKE